VESEEQGFGIKLLQQRWLGLYQSNGSLRPNETTYATEFRMDWPPQESLCDSGT
jgi:hypothetical protein